MFGPDSKEDLKKKEIEYTELLPIAGYQRQACSCAPPTRDTWIMGTKEALERLTRNKKINWIQKTNGLF